MNISYSTYVMLIINEKFTGNEIYFQNRKFNIYNNLENIPLYFQCSLNFPNIIEQMFQNIN